MNKINGKEKKVNQSTQTKNKKNITLKYKTKNIKKNKWEGEGGKPKYKQTNKQKPKVKKYNLKNRTKEGEGGKPKYTQTKSTDKKFKLNKTRTQNMLKHFLLFI